MSSSDLEREFDDVSGEEEDEKVADEENRDDFSDEYRRWKSETDGVLGYLDELRQGLDQRTAQVRSESLQALAENTDDVEAMRSQLETMRKMLRATNAFVADDFSSSLEALRQSLATYSEVTLGKLNDTRTEVTAPGTTTSHCQSFNVTIHPSDTLYTSRSKTRRVPLLPQM